MRRAPGSRPRRREPDGRLAFTAEVASEDLARLKPLIRVALAGDLTARVEASGQPRQLAGSADFHGQTLTFAEHVALWGVNGEVMLGRAAGIASTSR